MTAPPLPTFVPQDAWYNLTLGNINPSVADPVPNTTYLSPANGQNGLVGPFDGATVILAGTVKELDGTQQILMWVSTSTDAADGATVFNPWVVTTTPGHWKQFSRGGGARFPAVLDTVTVPSRHVLWILSPSAAATVQVFVKGIEPTNPQAQTNIVMPGTTFPGQTFSFKDSQGNCATYPIVITAPNIDGGTTFTLNVNYAQIALTWNGTSWSVT